MLAARQQGFSVDYKSANDIVTNVDRDIETFLREQIQDLFPGDGIHGEEFGVSASSTTREWLIDPIDGTTNFAQGIPMYCVSIALQEEGETIVGAIYEPNRDELFSASKKGGAHLNGTSLRVSLQNTIDQSILITGLPPVKHGDKFEQIIHQLGHMIRDSRGLRRLGSAALDLAYVACGRIDCFWEFGLKPWDTAAGYLLVNEAGGRVTDVQGNVFTAHEESVVATNSLIHEDALSTLTHAISNNFSRKP